MRRAAALAALVSFLHAFLAIPAARATSTQDLVALGNQRYLRGEVPEARAEYEKALSARPDDPQAHYNLGVLLFETGDLDHALEHFERAAKEEPSLAAAWNNLAIVLCAKGYFDQAEEAAGHALLAAPDFAPARNNLGLILEAQGRSEEARRAFAAAIAVDSRLGEAQNNLANTLARAGRADEAMDGYDRAIAANPRLAYAYFNRGLLALRGGDQNAAVRDWEKARRIDPAAAPDFAIASVALRGGDYARAIRHFESAEARGVDRLSDVNLTDFKPLFSPQGIDAPGLSPARRGATAPSGGKGLSGDPTRLSTEYTDLARVNHERGRDQRAMELLEDALALNPANAPARDTLGRIHLQRGEIPEAIAVLAPIEQESRDAGALVLLGNAYERGDRLPDAQRAYARAVALDPKNARARVGLGWIQTRARNPEAGIAEIEKGVDLAPRDSYARVALADALAMDDRVVHAEREYERAIRDNPTDARAHAHYASFLASQGRTTEARKSYEKALMQDPDEPGVADEIARLGRRRNAKFGSVWEGILLMPILPFIGISALFSKLAE